MISIVKILVLIIVYACVTVSCANFTISNQKVADIDLASIRSYAYQSGVDIKTGGHAINIVHLDEAFRSELDKVLGAKGLLKSDVKSAEVLISYKIEIESKSDAVSLEVEKLGDSPYKGGIGSVGDSTAIVQGLDAPRTSEFYYTDIAVEMAKSASMKLLWKGKGGVALPAVPDYPKLNQKFKRLFDKMFNDFH
jgi:hypothetical protein